MKKIIYLLCAFTLIFMVVPVIHIFKIQMNFIKLQF